MSNRDSQEKGLLGGWDSDRQGAWVQTPPMKAQRVTLCPSQTATVANLTGLLLQENREGENGVLSHFESRQQGEKQDLNKHSSLSGSRKNFVAGCSLLKWHKRLSRAPWNSSLLPPFGRNVQPATCSGPANSTLDKLETSLQAGERSREPSLASRSTWPSCQGEQELWQAAATRGIHLFRPSPTNRGS